LKPSLIQLLLDQLNIERSSGGSGAYRPTVDVSTVGSLQSFLGVNQQSPAFHVLTIRDSTQRPGFVVSSVQQQQRH
jgi:hypothetical protein